jgi:hypothetical protein
MHPWPAVLPAAVHMHWVLQSTLHQALEHDAVRIQPCGATNAMLQQLGHQRCTCQGNPACSLRIASSWVPRYLQQASCSPCARHRKSLDAQNGRVASWADTLPPCPGVSGSLAVAGLAQPHGTHSQVLRLLSALERPARSCRQHTSWADESYCAGSTTSKASALTASKKAVHFMRPRCI